MLLITAVALIGYAGFTSKLSTSKVVMQGFGGGEATRDAAPTYNNPNGGAGGEETRDPAPTYDPNDPNAKQGTIKKAESFADYLQRTRGKK